MREHGQWKEAMKKPKDTERRLVAPHDLAQQINEHHAACQSAMQTALQHAIAAGELLVQAKIGVPHGKWADWLAKNFCSSQNTANLYVRLYENRQILNGVGNLISIREADKLTRKKKIAGDNVVDALPPPSESTKPTPPNDEITTAITKAVSKFGMADIEFAFWNFKLANATGSYAETLRRHLKECYPDRTLHGEEPETDE